MSVYWKTVLWNCTYLAAITCHSLKNTKCIFLKKTSLNYIKILCILVCILRIKIDDQTNTCELLSHRSKNKSHLPFPQDTVPQTSPAWVLFMTYSPPWTMERFMMKFSTVSQLWVTGPSRKCVPSWAPLLGP